MDKEEIFFIKISENLVKNHKDVKLGKMMSSPGIKFQDKVFAFYYNHEMVFRLGVNADPKELGIKKFHLLNPFKNKAPMKNWFVVPFSESVKWECLAKYALKELSNELNSR